MGTALRPRRPGHGSTAKATKPEAPAGAIARPRLLTALDAAAKRRLTIVVAGAGFGKSTLLTTWAAGRPSAWYTVTAADRSFTAFARGLVDALATVQPAILAATGPDVEAGAGPDAGAEDHRRAQAFASLLCDAIYRRPRRDLVLVLDDLDELGGEGAAVTLVEALCRQAPPNLHLVLASRTGPPFRVERLRAEGRIATLTGPLLAFSEAETADALEAVIDADARALASRILALTGGWPALTRLAAEALRQTDAGARPRVLDRLSRAGGGLFEYIAEEAFAREPAGVRKLVATVAPLERFSVDLCEALGLAGAGQVLEDLDRRGLFVGSIDGGETYALHPLIRAFASERLTDPAIDARAIRRTAAAWHEARREYAAALASLLAAGDGEALARFLERRGGDLLAAGEVDAVVAAAQAVPTRLRTPRLAMLEGEARQVRGDWDAALACFERAAVASDTMSAGVAWRIGLIHHLRGELDEALETYGRGAGGDGLRVDPGMTQAEQDQGPGEVAPGDPERGDPRPGDLGRGKLGRGEPLAPVEIGADMRDEALLHAWWASALWLRGDTEPCRVLARRAFTEATVAGDDRALAAAHTILAMLAATDSDRRANDAHYLKALDCAARSNDVLQTIRIRANRGSRLVEEGSYAEAIAELDDAIRLADVAGFASYRALALSNRGEALFRLGRLDEAVSDLNASKALYQRLESRLVGYPLCHLGDVYRERGDNALARAAYEESIEVATAAGDQQGLVPALAGLAVVLARDDPETAARLARQAVAAGPSLGRVTALLATGWVALARGNVLEARRAATEAAATARARRDRAGLAEALEIEAAASETAVAVERLEEAAAIWREIASPIGERRAQLSLGRRGRHPDSAAEMRAARRELGDMGARRYVDSAGPTDGGAARLAAVVIRTLGGFEVQRDGRHVAIAEWQSRKARDLLKLLVTRRGRPVAREVLIEALWPEDELGRAGRRLSVTLSTLRAVLDPAHRHPSDRFVAADSASVSLVVANVSVDVLEFIDAARDGLAAAELVRARSASGGSGGEPDTGANAPGKTEAAERLEVAADRLRAAEAAYRGEFLEENLYDDWAATMREEARLLYLRVAHELAAIEAGRGNRDLAAAFLLRVLERDPYDERAHLGLVAALAGGDRHGEARRAYRAYVSRMEELGVEAAAFPEPA